MLSSRPQHALYVDKENVTSIAPQRKGNNSEASIQNTLQTPRLKTLQNPGSRTVRASSSKPLGETTYNKAQKPYGHNIALEPGSRILGAKDGNNRAGLEPNTARRAGRGKGKALHLAHEDCSLMSSITQRATTGTTSSPRIACHFETQISTTSSSSRAPKQQGSTKTPARAKVNKVRSVETPLAAPLKTPREATQAFKRASPRHNDLFPALSAFKTPSPNHLLRRRVGGGSPVPLHFNPTSLRGDDLSETSSENKPVKPTLWDEIDAQHALIDDLQEVDCATRQAIDTEALPIHLPFEMPNYKDLDILNLNFQSVFSQGIASASEPPMPILLDDSEIHLRDYLYEVEPEREQLFPRLDSAFKKPFLGHLSQGDGGHSQVDRRTKARPRPLNGRTTYPSKVSTSESQGEKKSAISQHPRRVALLPNPHSLVLPVQRAKTAHLSLGSECSAEVVIFELGEIDLLL